MFGEFSGEEEFDGGLDFTGRHGVSFVVSDQLGGFEGESFEGVVDEGVHDVHGFLGNSSFGVDLSQNLTKIFYYYITNKLQ